MSNAKTPMQRQREERRALGWRDVNIWLTPEGQQRVSRLSEPGESLSTLIDRALAALDILHSRRGSRAEPSDVSSEVVHQEDLQAVIAREVSRYFDSETFRDRLFIPLLKQTISGYLPSEPTGERARESPSTLSRDVTRQRPPAQKAELLTRIRDLKTEGFSLQYIADRLNADGVPTISGRGRWQKGTIGNLLAQT